MNLLTRPLAALLLLATTGLAQFPGAGGDYGGLLEGPTNSPDDSGILTVQLRDSGMATIRLIWQGQVYPIKATFDTDGNLIRKVKKKNVTTDTEMDLVCVLDAGGRNIGGVLNDPTALGGGFILSGAVPDPALTTQLEPGLRMSFIDPLASPAAPEAGPSPAPDVAEDGFAVVTIGKTARRSTRFVGGLPDSTKFSAGSPLRGAKYALRSGLYSQPRGGGSGGQVLGLGDVSSTTMAPAEGRDPRGISGTAAQLIAGFRWHKKTGIQTRSYPGGIDQRVDLDTVPYARSSDARFMLTGQRLPANATLRMQNGNLGTRAENPGPNPITVNMNISFLGARIVGPNPHKVKISVNPLTAKFAGSFKHPDTEELMRFKGAFRSFFGVVPGEGRGNFLSRGSGRSPDPAEARSGSVRISVN